MFLNEIYYSRRCKFSLQNSKSSLVCLQNPQIFIRVPNRKGYDNSTIIVYGDIL